MTNNTSHGTWHMAHGTWLKNSFLLILFFMFTNSYLSAQTYSGQVTDACSKKPLKGVEIGLTSNVGVTTTVTDAFGNWNRNVSFYSGATYWIISVAQPGVSSPGSLYVVDNNQNMGGLNFNYLADDWNFAFDLNGENIPFYNSPPYYTTPGNPVNLCSNENICLSLSDEYTTPIHGTDECYTFRISIHTTNQSGNPITFIGDDCFNVDGRPAIGTEPCGLPYSFDINAILNSSEVNPSPNTPLVVKIEQFCCSKRCGPGEGTLVNSEHFFIAVNSILQADVDFQFISSNLSIDALNGNDNPTDGLDPTSQTIPGPALADVTWGIDASIVQNSGAPLTQVTYTIEEVECANPNNAQVIFENTVNLNNTGQPENYTFANDFRFDTGFPPPFDNIPWFAWDANTVGKCFQVTVTVSNDCGDASASSYFTISESCQFCMIGLPNGGVNETVDADYLYEKERVNTNPIVGLNVYPNPARSNILFKVNSQELMTISLFDISGRAVDSFTISSDIEYDLSEFPAGTYFYRWVSGAEKGVGKIVKL